MQRLVSALVVFALLNGTSSQFQPPIFHFFFYPLPPVVLRTVRSDVEPCIVMVDEPCMITEPVLRQGPIIHPPRPPVKVPIKNPSKPSSVNKRPVIFPALHGTAFLPEKNQHHGLEPIPVKSQHDPVLGTPESHLQIRALSDDKAFETVTEKVQSTTGRVTERSTTTTIKVTTKKTPHRATTKRVTTKLPGVTSKIPVTSTTVKVTSLLTGSPTPSVSIVSSTTPSGDDELPGWVTPSRATTSERVTTKLPQGPGVPGESSLTQTTTEEPYTLPFAPFAVAASFPTRNKGQVNFG